MTATLQQAIAHHRRGELGQAEALYREILAQAPGQFDALQLLGVVRTQQGRHAEAVALIGKAIGVDPRHAGAHSNLGLALRNLGRLDEALASYDRALALKPDSPEALNNRGNVLLGLHRPEEALASFDRALALRPDYAEALNNRGNALRALERPDDALASYDRALALSPDFADALNNRGSALRELRRSAAALADFDRALALAPGHVDALDNRGIALADLGEARAALASFDRALALAPGRARAHHHASLIRLLLGDFENGWREHEWRWQDEQLADARRGFAQPLWLGDRDIAGKTVLLHAEQGYGDTIQFCRYAGPVAKRGANVLLEAPAALAPLFSSLSGVSRVLVAGQPLPRFDLHCPLLSLPLALGTTLDSIPAETPYLRADPAAVAKWHGILGERTRPRIGLAWSGSAAQRNDHNRSMALADLVPLLSPVAEFVSLQKDVRTTDRSMLLSRGDLRPFGETLPDFADTAALIEVLDLVITVDTSVAHLAGAMGKPVWILLCFAADWRWLQHRGDCPWYPTARLFRQPAIGDWAGVVGQVANELRVHFR